MNSWRIRSEALFILLRYLEMSVLLERTDLTVSSVNFLLPAIEKFSERKKFLFCGCLAKDFLHIFVEDLKRRGDQKHLAGSKPTL